MSPSRKFTLEEARQIGESIGADFSTVDLQEFSDGLSIELEHGARDPQTNVTNDNLVMTGKIALAHLKEFPDYYTRLEKLEQEADAYWQAKKLEHA